REVFLGHLATVIESAVGEVIPSETQVRRRNNRSAVHRRQLTRRQERKRMYASTQKLYRKNRGRCFNSINNGSVDSEFKVTLGLCTRFRG
ncbi:hypothetical protein AVEN_274157-1, partial [Araneus ventricosus]